MEMENFLCNINNDECPFSNLKLSEDWKRLHSLDERSECPKCKKSRKYFCYTCFLSVSEVEPYLPRLNLPIKLDVIKHNREIDGKSTAVHAAVLAPEQVTMYTYPCIPNYNNEQRVILVFPGKNASSVEDIISSMKRNIEEIEGLQEEKPVNKVVFIDSTWNQTKGILKDPRISSLPCAVLKPRLSQFWRHQKGSPRTHLATIEAIHQFFIEYHLAMDKLKSEETGTNVLTNNSSLVGDIQTEDRLLVASQFKYNGEYDNLMFFFRFMYDKIHNLYDHDSLLSYKRPVI